MDEGEKEVAVAKQGRQGILAKALSYVSKVVVATQIYAGDKITSD